MSWSGQGLTARGAARGGRREGNASGARSACTGGRQPAPEKQGRRPLPPPCPRPRLVKDSSAWDNKKETLEAEQAGCTQLAASLAELDEEGLQARVAHAREERDAAQAACEAAAEAVKAAESELAGAEAGDGRDASNRSLQERLADARNAQVGPAATVGCQ